MNVGMWCHRHQRSILFLIAILALGGIGSALELPVALFPDVAFPRIRVDIDAGDLPATQTVAAVTTPVEEAIRRVRGVRSVRSTTSRGSAEVNVDFDWNTDMARAFLDVNAATSNTLPDLPAGTRIHAMRMDPTADEPVVAYSLRADTLTATQLHDLAEYQLRPLLSGVPGVARVEVQGRGRAEFHIDADPAKLRALGLTLGDLTQAVGQAADISALGHLTDHDRLLLLLGANQPTSVTLLRQIVVRAGPRGVIRVGDVATVQAGNVPQWMLTEADGHAALLLQVFQQPGANSVAMVDAVKARLAGYRAQLPHGVHLAAWYDQTKLVRASATSVRDALAIGVMLAAFVLFAFLHNRRVIAMVMLVVPATLAITTLLLMALGMSFNMMTLGGMAAAVGLLIDDVVVMTEHIMRRLAVSGGNVHERIMRAAHDFVRPQTGSSLATIVIFLPLAFLSGVTGAFFKALSLTMASALVISWLLTLLAVPLLAEHLLLDPGHTLAHAPGRLWRGGLDLYARTLDAVLQRPAWLLLGSVPLLVAGAIAYRAVDTGFMPPMDEGGFTLDYLARPGTSLQETNRLLRNVDAILAANPYVDTWSRRTGLQLGGGLTEANSGDFFIRLKDGSRPSTDQVMERIRATVSARVPGLDVDVAQLLEDMIGDLTAVPQPIAVKLYSDDVTQLDATAHKIARQLATIPGVVSVRDGINLAGDALEVAVDPIKAALLGLSPKAVGDQVAAAVAGTVAASLPSGPKMVGIRVWMAPRARTQIDELAALPISDGHGHTFPLARLASITSQHGQPEIDHDNLKRMLTVTARISGRDLGSTLRDVQRVLATHGELPPGMYVELGGLYQQQQLAFRGLTLVLLTALALVFTLLLFLYESFRVALTILVQPMLAICGVFLGLWLTNTELDISSMMGLTMIVGIVTELAIFYFSDPGAAITTVDASPSMLRQALLAAGQNRARAIVMSALASILALAPLALALGRGAQMQQPLAIAIISGMLVAVPLVLIVMPGLYVLLRRSGTAV